MGEALVLEKISKSFKSGSDTIKAVEAVSLSIHQNEFFTLLGPSGCGKTTLLRLIAGLETAESGRILLAGEDIRTAARPSPPGQYRVSELRAVPAHERGG